MTELNLFLRFNAPSNDGNSAYSNEAKNKIVDILFLFFLKIGLVENYSSCGYTLNNKEQYCCDYNLLKNQFYQFRSSSSHKVLLLLVLGFYLLFLNSYPLSLYFLGHIPHNSSKAALLLITTLLLVIRPNLFAERYFYTLSIQWLLLRYYIFCFYFFFLSYF